MGMVMVEKLSFRYANRQVLKDISFSIQKGSVCGILGQNGTGKTTLLKCIHGLLNPECGDVLIKGRSVYSMNYKERARNISTVPQNINIIFSYTVLNIVLMAKVSKGNLFTSPSKDDEREVIKILDNLKIGHLSYKRFNELSGGEKQMVLIARAMYQDTPIILLDEPTAHLDYKNQIMIMDTIKDVVKKKNLTAIINIHDPNLALNYCDSIVMIKSGSVLIKGKTKDIICENYLSNLYDMPVLVDKTKNGRSVVIPFSA